MSDTCPDCRHCGQDGYCDVKEKNINPNSSPCPEFEEH